MVITLPNGNTAGLQDYIQMCTRNWEVHMYMLNLTSAQLLYLVVFIQLRSIPTPSIQTIIREAQSYQKSIWFLLLINDLVTRLRSGTQQKVRELFILDGAALTSITEISSDVFLLSGKWNLVNPGIQRLKFLFAQVSHQNHLGINRTNRPKSETRADSTILLSVPSACRALGDLSFTVVIDTYAPPTKLLRRA